MTSSLQPSVRFRCGVVVPVRLRALALSVLVLAACTESTAAEVGPGGRHEDTASPARQPDASEEADVVRSGDEPDASSAHAVDASMPAKRGGGDDNEDGDRERDRDNDSDNGDHGNDDGDNDSDDGDHGNDDDAGTVPPCDSRTCLCTTLCMRGTSLSCIDEAPLSDCITLCDQAPPPACADESAAALACNAAQPLGNYSCDPVLWVFVVAGCATEEAALQACRIR